MLNWVLNIWIHCFRTLVDIFQKVWYLHDFPRLENLLFSQRLETMAKMFLKRWLRMIQQNLEIFFSPTCFCLKNILQNVKSLVLHPSLQSDLPKCLKSKGGTQKYKCWFKSEIINKRRCRKYVSFLESFSSSKAIILRLSINHENLTWHPK